MNAPGECDTLLAASGRSFPLDEVAKPMTFTFGRSAWSTSQQRASSATYAAGAALSPFASNCGRQKWLLFGSFQITTSLMCGNRTSASRAYAQYASRASGVSGAAAPDAA